MVLVTSAKMINGGCQANLELSSYLMPIPTTLSHLQRNMLGTKPIKYSLTFKLVIPSPLHPPASGEFLKQAYQRH